MDEVPLRIRTNPLLSAFLTTLTSSPSTSPSSTLLPSPSHRLSSSSSAPAVPAAIAAAVPPSFAALDLDSRALTKNLTSVLDALDDYKTEEGNLAYLARQIARERARADAHLQKRREENALRAGQGLAPLPEDDVARMFKIPPEPSRLESTLLLGQVDAYAHSLAEGASVNLVKMYAANGGSPA